MKEETIISFLASFNFISPKDLEEILEYLDDRNYLSKEGKKFRDTLWKMFIKEDL